MSSNKLASLTYGVLADTYTLCVKTQNYHWNVVGPHFFSLHKLFEEQYEEMFAAVDILAEHIRTLGQPVDGTFQGFLSATKISEGSESEAMGMVADLSACHEKLVGRIQAALKVAGDSESTIDLLVNRLRFHQTAMWKLKSTLGDQSGIALAQSQPEAKQEKPAKPLASEKAPKVKKTKTVPKQKRRIALG